jgi:hypothetical protein
VGSVTCEVQYSRRVGALVFAAALATGGITFAMPLPVSWRVALLLWVLLLACRSMRRLGEVRALRLDEDGAVEVLFADGSRQRGLLRAGSCVLPWLVVLRWRAQGGWVDRCVFLAPGMVNAENFRALRVLLRWQKP